MTERDRTEERALGRRLAESLRRAAEIAERGETGDVRAGPETLPPEPRGFAEGVAAAKHLREDVCPSGVSPYGPYVAPPERGVSLRERDELVRFPPHLQRLFAEVTPEMAALWLRWLRRTVERETVGRWWRRTWKVAAGIVVAAFAAARWGLDQIPVVREISDLVRAVLALLRGHGP